MNALGLLFQKNFSPERIAFYRLDSKPVTFQDLMRFSKNAQDEMVRLGLGAGDSILLADSISAEFYAAIIGAMGLGIRIILVEPFLPLKEIESVVSLMKPRLFITSIPGRVWGMRVGAIRAIPIWRSAKCLSHSYRSQKELKIVSLSQDDPAIITFTSGTSLGSSKGVVRTHKNLIAQNLAIRSSVPIDRYRGPDLAIFANLTLANLGMGRGTLYLPPSWRTSDIKKVQELPQEEQPETLSCGPAFLEAFVSKSEIPRGLKSIHVGGALSEVSVLQNAFGKIPDADFWHVYGSSEAEPVAFCNAKEAVSRSVEKGLSHTLFLGSPVSGVVVYSEPDTLWVHGDHVCGPYLANPEENKKSKRVDPSGNAWHSMGDRIRQESDGLWYQGRTFQKAEDFELEQRIYRVIGHTRGFIFRNGLGERILSGEGIKSFEPMIRKKFPEIVRVQEKKIVRDRRHRARIDREASR